MCWGTLQEEGQRKGVSRRKLQLLTPSPSHHPPAYLKGRGHSFIQLILTKQFLWNRVVNKTYKSPHPERIYVLVGQGDQQYRNNYSMPVSDVG